MYGELKTVKSDIKRSLELRQYTRQGIPFWSQKMCTCHLLFCIFLIIPIKQLEVLQGFLQNCSYCEMYPFNQIH